jgi:hypothetical protein
VLSVPAVFLRGAEPPIEQGKSRDFGTYVLNNNDWGKASSPTGWQIIDAIEPGQKISWRVRYNWPAGSNPHGVKCYPSVITGWQWGLWSSDGRLPRTVGSLHRVTTGATAKVENPAVQNVAYDLWFHAPGSKPDDQKKPTDELMIWMAALGGAGPLGKRVETVKLAGAEWKLNVGDIGWKVYSFVRTEPCEQWNVDAKVFIDYLVEHGYMAKDKQLTSVEFGTEVFRTKGDGALQVKDYFVDIE